MDTFISGLHVKNIGQFENLDIEFSSNCNIIVGPNSSGKTSILKFICFCLSEHHLEYMRFKNNAEFWVNANHENIKYRIGATNIVNKDQDYRRIEINNWGQVPSENVDKTLFNHNNNIYNILAIGANRYFDYTQIQGMQREKNGQESIRFYREKNIEFLDKPLLPNIKQWMINRYFVIDKDWAKIEKNNWYSIMKLLPKISPKNSNLKFVKIERDLEPLFSINDKTCYFEELSSGFKSFLSIVFSIIDWGESIFENEEALIANIRGTVLIDEIDAHLHPEWQSQIIKNLKLIFPKIQFIITTHSPHVIASASENELIIIPKHNGSINIGPDQRNFKNWQLEFILEDLMGLFNYDENINHYLELLDKFIEKANLAKFDEKLKELEQILHKNDPIIKVYKIKRGNIFLSQEI